MLIECEEGEEPVGEEEEIMLEPRVRKTGTEPELSLHAMEGNAPPGLSGYWVR